MILLINDQVFNDVIYFRFENQEDINNGMWLHLTFETGSTLFKGDKCSIEFDPHEDSLFVVR